METKNFQKMYKNFLNPEYHRNPLNYNDNDFPTENEGYKIGRETAYLSNYKRKSTIKCEIFYNSKSYKENKFLVDIKTREKKINKSFFSTEFSFYENKKKIKIKKKNETEQKISIENFSLTSLNKKNPFKKRVSKNLNLQKNISIPKKHFVKEKKKNPIIIYLHSHGSNLYEGKNLIKKFTKNKIDICLFDFSGFGYSSGNRVTFGLKEKLDVEVIIFYLKKKWDYKEIGIYGKSIGALTGLLYSINSFDINFLILDSLFLNLKKTALVFMKMKNNFKMYDFVLKWGIDFFFNKLKVEENLDFNKIDLTKIAIQLNIPVFLIFGDNDELTTFEEINKINNLFNCEKRLLIVGNCDHFTNKLYNENILMSVLNFAKSIFKENQKNNKEVFLNSKSLSLSSIQQNFEASSYLDNSIFFKNNREILKENKLDDFTRILNEEYFKDFEDPKKKISIKKFKRESKY